ncbi:hypothetical protein [Paraburkholderia sp. SIMBA_030]|uniref:hypothetical protein n=1 Tax=Paraburkholderia sp. SIMBA_030 TaxID=3085773 RepID=UPI003977E7DF
MRTPALPVTINLSATRGGKGFTVSASLPTLRQDAVLGDDGSALIVPDDGGPVLLRVATMTEGTGFRLRGVRYPSARGRTTGRPPDVAGCAMLGGRQHTAPRYVMPIQPELHAPLDLTADTMLYRGVNRSMRDDGVGLRPRDASKPFEKHVFFDGTWKCDGAVIFGDSHSQAVHAYQWDSEGFNGPALSFSTIEAVARRFATTDGMTDGVVYAVTVTELEAAGCVFEDPRRHTSGLQSPHEHEVNVVPPTDRELSLDLVRVTEVSV